MIYALNLFNLVPGKEDTYREYSAKAGKLIYGRGGRIVCSGHQPVRHLMTDGVKRSQFIVVEFPSEEAFEKFHSPAKYQLIHRLRETSTQDYIWILFKTWDLQNG
jgi:uncharacterized protein (DUF1330 family)